MSRVNDFIWLIKAHHLRFHELANISAISDQRLYEAVNVLQSYDETLDVRPHRGGVRADLA